MRTAYLEILGLKVLRVTNTGVYEGLSWICDQILAECETLAPQRGEREG